MSDAVSDAAALSKALTVRAELLKALATMARAAGPDANAIKIAAQLAADADGDATRRAARRVHRNGNPVAGLLGDQVRARSAHPNTLRGHPIWAGAVLTYRTDAEYHATDPNMLFPAAWHRAVVARIAQEVPGLSIVFPDEDHFASAPE